MNKTNINSDALELTNKFTKGAPCPINKNMEETMFWPFYEKIAKDSGFDEITVEVVKEYWFTVHNRLVVKRFHAGHLDREKAINCMVRAIKIENSQLACIHGGFIVCDISEDEFRNLIEKNRPLIDEIG